MLRISKSGGFIVCALLNMFLNWELGGLAFFLWVAAEWFGLSHIPSYVALGLWFLLGFGIAGVFAWTGSQRVLNSDRDLPNINPYSSTNREFDFSSENFSAEPINEEEEGEEKEIGNGEGAKVVDGAAVPYFMVRLEGNDARH